MKKIEIPYNFRPTYWRGLVAIKDFAEYIKFIYVPAWKEEGAENTRDYLWTELWMPKSWEEYVERIKIMQTFNIPISILLQSGGTYEIFRKYYDLGIRYFTLGSDELAKEIKSKHNDVYLVASLTKILSFDDICNNDYTMYDEIVLWFWFNRHLETIKQLPTKYKYCIQSNATCYYDCKWYKYHWFEFNNRNRLNGPQDLPCYPYRKGTRRQIVICPEDLSYFDPYINSYKIIDRESTTLEIMSYFMAYALRNSNFYSEYLPPINMKYYMETGHARPEEFYDITKECEEQWIDDDVQYEMYLRELRKVMEEEDRKKWQIL